MQEFHQWLDQQGLKISGQQPLPGGCIAESRLFNLNDGQRLFVKQPCLPAQGQSIPDMFAAEVAGLKALAKAGMPTPEIRFANDQILVLSYIEPGPATAASETRLGELLAQLHRRNSADFGFERDTFCGTTRQPNNRLQDGYLYYAQRYRHLARLCNEQGLLDNHTRTAIETLAERLAQWIPAQSPALLHGDLWSGNVLTDPHEQPWLIDPAVYCGWPEADLAMTALFGGFSARFYQAYTGVRPLESGWRERFPLYNLWHLLNHLLLFGASYRADVEVIVARYV